MPTIETDTGAEITVHSQGNGPGLVLLHGGGVGFREYARPARAFAQHFTVHLYNRRGRPGAAPMDETYSIATDIADLAAVLRHTGARDIFGHSGGGFVALRAALTLPLRKIAVYDPAIPTPGRLPPAQLNALETAVTIGNYPLAIATMFRIANPHAAASKMPLSWHTLMAKAFLSTPLGHRFAEVMPTIPRELNELAAHAGPPSDYAPITAEVLLAAGTRSPAHFAQDCHAVAAEIPHARSITIPGGTHNSANIARKPFMQPFLDFLST
ncbi:hypothetical protein GCM10010435_69080 [Winogradskya consettensis]|uniref:AB hydrolase-1 domain-containing protein n=1 Tax=Winogradskya consettensis TaxID=113560 RepID=A0A919SKS0_9ACTN|nr:alpha/beta hydrolase [Actinoplanes consettensis]GIM73529.1 hypothetical protein Aco04nite_35700 [Actinoplanes consettensis]